jgi:predicted transposase/invertase (TIGR01784 family)
MKNELLDPKNDFVFKRIFGSEENKDILLAFLNRTLLEAGESILTEIILLNPYTDKDSPRDKQSIFDIKAKTVDGSIVNIEMQLFNRYDNEKRTLYYWSKQYSEQLKEGNPYKQLKKCITINIVDFSFLPNDQYHNVFHLREIKSGISLNDDLEIHFLELAKLDSHKIPTNGGLVHWLLFLKSRNKKQWEVLKMREPVLGKAMTVLEFLSQDEEARRLYEMRQKALHDEASSLAGAKEEGIKEGIKIGTEKGKEEGRREEKVNTVRAMLQNGIDINVICEVTKLTKEEIAALQIQITKKSNTE